MRTEIYRSLPDNKPCVPTFCHNINKRHRIIKTFSGGNRCIDCGYYTSNGDKVTVSIVSRRDKTEG